jgi:hypothetical protein
MFNDASQANLISIEVHGDSLKDHNERYLWIYRINCVLLTTISVTSAHSKCILCKWYIHVAIIWVFSVI